MIGLLRGDDVVVAASDCNGGVWIVPWISRRARPDGVLRRVGRGLFCCIWGVDGRWSGIDGMAKGFVLLVLHAYSDLLESWSGTNTSPGQSRESHSGQPCRLHSLDQA